MPFDVHGQPAAVQNWLGRYKVQISDKDTLVGDACKGGVVLEMRDILDKGWRVGVVLSLSHTLSGKPGNGIAGGVIVTARYA